MANQFTPGPWVHTSDENREIVSSEVYGGICLIPHNGKHTEEHKANANLIAAAPELLEALENYTKVMERFLETMPDEFVVDLIAAAVVRDAHVQAKAAITKATGGVQ